MLEKEKWSEQEINTLLVIWSQDVSQDQLRNGGQNQFFGIASGFLKKQGWNKTAQQCRTKLAGLQKTFRQAHDTNGAEEWWFKYFHYVQDSEHQLWASSSNSASASGEEGNSGPETAVVRATEGNATAVTASDADDDGMSFTSSSSRRSLPWHSDITTSTPPALGSPPEQQAPTPGPRSRTASQSSVSHSAVTTSQQPQRIPHIGFPPKEPPTQPLNVGSSPTRELEDGSNDGVLNSPHHKRKRESDEGGAPGNTPQLTALLRIVAEVGREHARVQRDQLAWEKLKFERQLESEAAKRRDERDLKERELKLLERRIELEHTREMRRIALQEQWVQQGRDLSRQTNRHGDSSPLDLLSL